MYTIVICGCGATGSNLVALLSQYAISEKKIKEIVLIDGDIVEPKNFLNQKYTSRDVNKYKSRVLAERYSRLGINISYIDRYIESENDLITILSDKRNIILVGCVDNNIARRYLHKTFYSDCIRNLIYIDTGNGAADDHTGQTVCGAKQNNKVIVPPVGDIYPQVLEEDLDNLEDTKVDNYTCSRIEEHPQNLVVNAMSSMVTFCMINNIVSLSRNSNNIVRFNTDKIFVK